MTGLGSARGDTQTLIHGPPEALGPDNSLALLVQSPLPSLRTPLLHEVCPQPLLARHGCELTLAPAHGLCVLDWVHGSRAAWLLESCCKSPCLGPSCVVGSPVIWIPRDPCFCPLHAGVARHGTTWPSERRKV